MKLSKAKPEFDALNINLVAMTFDAHGLAEDFLRKHKLKFPILQDVDQYHVKLLGILNDKYAPGHFAHGVPHPGMILVNKDGIIVAKFSESGFKKRPAIKLVLDTATRLNLGE